MHLINEDGFVASIIRNKLSINYAFFDNFFQNHFLPKIINCGDKLDYPGSIVYLSCCVWKMHILANMRPKTSRVGSFSAQRLSLFGVWQGRGCSRWMMTKCDMEGGVKNVGIFSDILFEWPVWCLFYEFTVKPHSIHK